MVNNSNMRITRKKSQTVVKCGDDQEAVDFETAIAETGYGLYNYLLLLSALFSALSHQSNIQLVSYLLPSAECDLQLTPFNKGLLNAAPFIGGISSAFVWGFLSDYYGRRSLLVIAYSLDGVLTLIASFSQAFWFLLMIKFFNGFIVAGPMAMQKTFLAEFHGFHHRSRVMMWTGFAVASASIFIPVIAWIIIPLPLYWELFEGMFIYNSWRMFVAVCGLPSFISAAIIYSFDETPKFLMSNGHKDEALKVLQKMYRWNTGKDSQSYPVKVLRGNELKEHESSAVGTQLKVNLSDMLKDGWNQSKVIFMNPHRPKAILVASIQFLTLYGMNTLRLWLPQLFASIEEYNHHHLTTNGSLSSASLCEIIAFTSGNNITKVQNHCSVAMLEDQVYLNAMIVGATTGVAFLLACYFVNVIRKKLLMVIGFIISGACGIAIFWSRDDVTTLSLSSVYVSLLNVCHTICIAVVVELFPTGVRNMAVSLTLMSGQLGSIVGNVTFPILLDLNCVVPFFFIGAIVLGCALLSLFVPRTKFLE
ncbi:synaptic vesicle glycoprotein 2B [Anabrus simplex]|uniref:synaptic vesicle glycoprotein 2B n=1 Tax=Anabrus simplex TaxID=316456 RepID=UPI0034DD9846